MQKVLITGGAGFVGSHVGKELLQGGYTVRAFDILSSQIHGTAQKRPDYLDPAIELITGDIRDASAVTKALDGVDAVIHLAAAVGVGQSMYEITHYMSTNTQGTAVLLEALMHKPVGKLVVASSMSIYGEGLYKTKKGELVSAAQRSTEQFKNHEWELKKGGEVLNPVPTPETKIPTLSSVYALSKYDQERMSMMLGDAYGIPTAALRLFNIYGPYQALSNPYTGVLAIFASRLLNNSAPVIYEDGNQRRDFVSVYDVARAFRFALEKPQAVGQVFNIGSGSPITITEVARELSHLLGKQIEPEISRKYRLGDIRHCFADITKARTLLGYEPQMPFREGLEDLIGWIQSSSAEDNTAQAQAALAARGLSG